MIRVSIEIEPAGNAELSRTLGEITIVNATQGGGRVSSDYLWRVRWLNPRNTEEQIAYGSLVDSWHGNVIDLVREVLERWKSGETACPDNHGQMVDLLKDHAAAWEKLDKSPIALGNK